MTGGHLGRTKTEHQVMRRAYWPTWRTDVRMWMRQCQPCAKYHRGGPPRQAALNPFAASEPFEVLAIDVTGPHPKSKNGNQYILTALDLFSKHAEAFPIRQHTAPLVARKLVELVFVRYVAPLRLLSDQGPEFESSLMADICRLLGIDKIRTSPYKASTNGACERFHRTLNSMIAKVVSENQRDWDEHVPMVLAAYRSTVHESTGFSPNYLIFGRENRMPADIVLASVNDPKTPERAECEYAVELIDRLRLAYQRAREHLQQCAETRKKAYDLRVKPAAYEVGQWVYYLYQRRYKGRSPKWISAYTGPYKIVEVIEPCNVVLAKNSRSKKFVVHTDKLKPYYGDPPEPGSRPVHAEGNGLADDPEDVVEDEDLTEVKHFQSDSSEDEGNEEIEAGAGADEIAPKQYIE